MYHLHCLALIQRLCKALQEVCRALSSMPVDHLHNTCRSPCTQRDRTSLQVTLCSIIQLDSLGFSMLLRYCERMLQHHYLLK